MGDPLNHLYSDLAGALKRASDTRNAIADEPPPNGGVRTVNARPTQPPFRLDSPMSPALAYGRHRGPVGPGTRHAAVAVTLYPDSARYPDSALPDSDTGDQSSDVTWHTILTTRPMTLRHHGGQVCFPGGRVEPGESMTEAAIREFTEELGRAPDVIAYCGVLPPQYVYASDNLVHPVVMLIRRPDQIWQPDPTEVGEVIQTPLPSIPGIAKRDSEVLSRNVRRKSEQVGEFKFRSPKFNIQGHAVWGATAMILAETVDTVFSA